MSTGDCWILLIFLAVRDCRLASQGWWVTMRPNMQIIGLLGQNTELTISQTHSGYQNIKNINS